MSDFAVESGIEIPARTRKATTRYPWTEMSTGDSFFVPYPTDATPGDKTKLMRAAGSAGSQWTKSHRPTHTVSSRNVESNGVDGFRVWMKLKGDPDA